MRNSFFISNTSTKLKISFSIAGMIILWGSIFALKKYTPDLNLIKEPRILYYAILVTLISAMGSLLGVIMILSHLNYKNKINQFILFLLMGILIGVSVYNSFTRIVLITLIVDAIIFFIVVILFKVYSTITTMIVTSFIYLLLVMSSSALLFLFVPNFTINLNSILYTLITLFLILYRIVGVWVNQFFISVVMSQKKIKHEYTSEVLVSHINLIYIVIFILINSTGLIYMQGDYNFYNVLNNCFITAIAINQVNWRSFKF